MAGKAPAEKRPVKVMTASRFHSTSSIKRHKAAQVPDNDPPTAAKHKHQQLSSTTFNPLSAPHKAFKTQKEAFEFLDKQPCATILRTFAQEVCSTGKRVFIVTTAEQFWRHYRTLSADERHHYEIIREAAPCNLYFDLEFCPQSNPNVDGPSLVQLLVSGIAQHLQQIYDIPFHPSYVLELDSSTPTKFSRHLIVKVPGMAFADCCHAGRFARLVLLRLLQQGQYNSQCTQLLVRDKEGTGLTSLVDMGVYTRNRAFRLYLSSKYGKPTVLRLTPRFGGARRDPQAAFHDLLVSVLHSNSSRSNGLSPASGCDAPLEGSPIQQQQESLPKVPSNKQHTRMSGQRQVSLLHLDGVDWQHELHQLPAAWQEVVMLQLNPLPHNTNSSSMLQQLPKCSLHHTGWHEHWQHRQQQQGCTPGGVSSMAAAGPAVVHHGPSPYPLLEQFITSISTQGGVQGEIRSWVSMPASASVAFNMRNNRFCGNVERQHRSNGIYYIVDLAGGVYYQKCYDPDCRNYRSNCMPLPTAVWQKYKQQTQLVQVQQQQQVWPQGSDQQHLQVHEVQQQGTVVTVVDTHDEDEQYLQLLHAYERQQQQQVQVQAQMGPSMAYASGVGSGTDTLDEDDMCLHLLQQVEQQAGLVDS